RNTAPAIALAALQAAPDALLVVLPADHVIRDVAAFQAAVQVAVPAAQAGKLATFGIVPTAPESGYGYIRQVSGPAGADAGSGTAGARAIERFIEKPDLATAQRFLQEGGYFWNSGMFLFRADRYLAELTRHAPDIAAAARAALAA